MQLPTGHLHLSVLVDISNSPRPKLSTWLPVPVIPLFPSSPKALSISVSGNPVLPVDYTKTLGVIPNSSLFFKPRIQSLRKSGSFYLQNTSRTRPLLSPTAVTGTNHSHLHLDHCKSLMMTFPFSLLSWLRLQADHDSLLKPSHSSAFYPEE